MPTTRPSYAETRESLRWRVALVLVALMSTLMLALGLLNTLLGLTDTALLAWIVFTLNATSLLGLLWLPRRAGTMAFFGVILGLAAGVLSGWLFCAVPDRKEAALEAELDMVVGVLNALRVMREWDRFEEGRN